MPIGTPSTRRRRTRRAFFETSPKVQKHQPGGMFSLVVPDDKSTIRSNTDNGSAEVRIPCGRTRGQVPDDDKGHGAGYRIQDRLPTLTVCMSRVDRARHPGRSGRFKLGTLVVAMSADRAASDHGDGRRQVSSPVAGSMQTWMGESILPGSPRLQITSLSPAVLLDPRLVQVHRFGEFIEWFSYQS